MPRLRSTEESKWIEPKLVLSWREERKAQTKFLNETSSLAVFHTMFLRVELAPQNLNGATRMTQGSLAPCYFLFWATKITISRSFFLSLLKWNRCTKTKFDYAAEVRDMYGSCCVWEFNFNFTHPFFAREHPPPPWTFAVSFLVLILLLLHSIK